MLNPDYFEMMRTLTEEQPPELDDLETAHQQYYREGE